MSEVLNDLARGLMDGSVKYDLIGGIGAEVRRPAGVHPRCPDRAGPLARPGW